MTLAEEKLPSMEEALAEVKSKPLVDLPVLCTLYDCCRGTGYEMVRRGEVDVVEVGKLKKVVSSSLRRKLGIER